jgi:hypothetical protein
VHRVSLPFRAVFLCFRRNAKKTLAIKRFANDFVFMYSNNTFTFSGSHGSAPRQAVSFNCPKSSTPLPALQSKKVLDQVRERIRYLYFSLRTEEAYLYWIRFYIRWSGVRHSSEMGDDALRAFLTHLAAERKVSVSTLSGVVCAAFPVSKGVVR